MVTTNRLIPVDTFASDAQGLIHLTGSFQMLARVTLGTPDAVPAHVELSFDAAQVRGVGLETGARYQARGAYRTMHDPQTLPNRLNLVGSFELLGYMRGNTQPTPMLLVVPFRVTVQRDGSALVELEEPTLLPCPGASMPPAPHPDPQAGRGTTTSGSKESEEMIV
jgi:hypothetical protein